MADGVVASITQPEERDRESLFERGRSLRQMTRRADQGAWEPAPGRDPVAVIEKQAETRVPELIAIRHGRMLESPFAFYRGAPAIMASDLATMPNTGIAVQACGDAHLLNFGLYATPERHLVFDLNDFDETLPAPWEWDLKRLAASLVVAGRSIGADAAATGAIVRASVVGYCSRLLELADLATLDVWYSRTDADDVGAVIGSKRVRTTAAKSIAKAKSRTNLQALEKLTTIVDGRRVIIDDPPLVQHVPALTAEDAQEFLTGYHATLESDHAHLLAQYRLVDAAMKVVGVGSVGTRCFVVVGEGWAGNDPLVLQIKEAEASVMSPHAGSSRYEHQGQRVVAGQRLMQAASDVFLGWSTGPEGRHFYVRQLRDMKGSAEIETMTLEDLTLYGGLCGATMAHAHARSVPPALLAGYCGRGEQLAAAITPFAQRYADQTEQDHEALADAVKSGRVAAELGI
jgi:uncharacterized protein (DUF2252 family)